AVVADAVAAEGRRMAGGFGAVLSAEAGMRVADAMRPVALDSGMADEGWVCGGSGIGSEACAATGDVTAGAVRINAAAGAERAGAGAIRANGSGSFSAASIA